MGAPSAPSEGRRSRGGRGGRGRGRGRGDDGKAGGRGRGGARGKGKGSDKPKPPPKKRDAKQPPKPRKPTPKQRAVEDARAADKVAKAALDAEAEEVRVGAVGEEDLAHPVAVALASVPIPALARWTASFSSPNIAVTAFGDSNI